MKAKITMLLIVGAAFFFVNQLNAQIVISGTKVVKSRGVSEYVIPSGDLVMEKPILSRGGCVVDLDNWTGYYIDIWVDKVYKGRLNPWESSQMILPEGYAEVFCRTMGETFQWQSAGECNEKFQLKLEEEEVEEEVDSKDESEGDF